MEVQKLHLRYQTIWLKEEKKSFMDKLMIQRKNHSKINLKRRKNCNIYEEKLRQRRGGRAQSFTNPLGGQNTELK